MSGTYVHVAAEDLNIGDRVRGLGRVTSVPFDHDTMPDRVVVPFELRGEERLMVMRAKRELRVRCEEEA